ncbi:transposase, partial [Roseinatronobacter sp.]|uniref:transposase n=1 Tax=Roseinatronobacter sp. TaxID=1945755 RepID=UPI0025FB71F7
MSDHRYRPEVEILSVTDTGRRRRWSDAEKVRIVEESFGPRGSMAATAHRHDIGRTLLVRWRRQYRNGELAGGRSQAIGSGKSCLKILLQPFSIVTARLSPPAAWRADGIRHVHNDVVCDVSY